MKAYCVALMLGMSPCVAYAGVVDNEPPQEHFTEEQISAIAYPELAEGSIATDDPQAEKYFYFHREGTSFDEAFADISECDALSSGISYYRYADPSAAMAQYGLLAGAVGGMIGNLIADAIFGSAERRKIRRENMRICMGYKEYQRYALDKDQWKEFNFEEGNTKVPADERRDYLLIQAKVASGPKPQTEVLEP